MSDIKSFEPLWGTWRILEPIGEGSFGKVYRAERTDFGNRYFSAIKHISIPSSENQKKEAIAYGLADGYDGLSKYFATITESLMQEINLMYEVKGNTNIVSYEDHLTIPKPDGVGCDIFIRMELLTSLNDIIISRSLPESEVIKLGIDMCSALEICASKNIIHRDIKPANIFVGANGEYKLGDFGIARHLENATTGMSKKGTYAYMSPEIYHGQLANLTADIYSLGLVMHRLLNDNRAPFMPIYPAPISAMDHENAMLKRISGSPIPPPAHASAALANIISKATQFDIRKRFAAPGEFKRALLQVQKGEELDSTLLLPVTTPQDEFTAVLDVSAGIEGTKTAILEDEITAKPKVKPTATPQSEQTQYAFESDKPATTNNKTTQTASKKPLLLGIAAVVVLIVVGVAVWLTTTSTSTFTDKVTVTDTDAVVDTVILYGKEFDCTSTSINLTDVKIDSLDELETSIKYFPNLESIKIGESLIDNETLHKFNQTHDAFISWKITIGDGKVINTAAKTLTLNGWGLTDISILKYCTNLTKLELGTHWINNEYQRNNISDISALTELTNLTYLDLTNNNISDLSPLSGLKNLTHLDLSINNISDISPLTKLTNLHILRLGFNNISNVSPLSGLTNLTELDLYDNNISNISPLSRLTNLCILNLDNNNISDISPIAMLTNLYTLDLRDNNISDISVLAGLTDLTYLDLDYNKINSIEPLLKLTKLEILWLVDCGITSAQKSQLASALPSCDIYYNW